MKADPEVLRGLADELDAGTQGAHGLAKIAMICTKEEWALIIAALRASQSDGAAAMREACARWHDYRAAEYEREARERTLPTGEWAGRDAMWARADAQAHREHATAIRALAQPDRLHETATGGETA